FEADDYDVIDTHINAYHKDKGEHEGQHLHHDLAIQLSGHGSHPESYNVDPVNYTYGSGGHDYGSGSYPGGSNAYAPGSLDYGSGSHPGGSNVYAPGSLDYGSGIPQFGPGTQSVPGIQYHDIDYTCRFRNGNTTD
uniref:Uncharacterized protein n=1 Tax=Meloidogyne javanica TaxID=6303 RepID=A0A915MZW4_MELJA